MFDVEITFGINIVEIITNGLYPNSLDALREYVQNSTDAIDEAVNAGILSDGDGEITIDIDADNRKITIEDNGIGISSSPKGFLRMMSNIGNSDKNLKTDRGFRGIGRLGGLAYCKKLVFSTKVGGEKKISTLTFNAEKLRQEFWNGKKRSAGAVLIENMKFDTIDATPETPEHFFRVELIDIVDTNTDLLDVAKVRDYLSFVAPVTYNPQFYYQELIYKHAATLNFKITEYNIRVNGEQVTKNYKANVRTKSGEDEIFGIEFRDLRDADDKLIAWLWFGLSTFKGILSEKHDSESYKMRGLRLRLGNIQIGDAETLQSLFNEARGTKYFIGEIHAIDKNLRPNSKRDDFEEDRAYNNLKVALKDCFDELHAVYHYASDIRSAYRDINEPTESEHEFKEKSLTYQKSHKDDFELKLATLKKTAATKKKFIDAERQKIQDNSVDTTKMKIFERITKQFPPLTPVTDEPSTVTGGGGYLNHHRQLRKMIFHLSIGAKIYANFTTRLKL